MIPGDRDSALERARSVKGGYAVDVKNEAVKGLGKFTRGESLNMSED